MQGQGAVTQSEIIDFLYDNIGQQMSFNKGDIELFMLRFDKYEKQRIKYSEFCTAFAPQSPRT